MSSMTQVKETNQRLEQRWFLINLEAAIDALDVHKLNATKLKELNLNVKLCRMTLDQNSEFKPHFFAPRPNLPQPSDEILNEACLVGDPEQCFTDPYSRAYAIHTDWNSYAFHQVRFDAHGPWCSKEPIDYTPYKDLYQHDDPSFGAFRMMDSEGSKFPHFKAVIYNDLEADNETCFRGELLISLRLMLGQLRKLRLAHHNIAPVLLISLMGKRARLLESYFDEKSKSLVVRSSDLYEFSNQTSISKAFKTLAEYFLGDAVGNTD
ncbi:uncharacterized protein N7479_002298 [Penicillium vulpinum]|uniref:Uncharacterized protein n=1 Tax=Penicillium vulpinum TaxID=29845 RepID=A0A1V6S7Z0_9EURO|nr:uncharacterized protein N7479_002298 [Penicillium vulpinum]KAJ5972380.1 hypothetical protein N7479_002298 [Penicillium vulpinum]OQE09824.1 hypothetical protein PENVUL_c005G08839 [Penicillium vulpinum]